MDNLKKLSISETESHDVSISRRDITAIKIPILNSSTTNESKNQKIDRFKIIKNMEEVLKSVKKHKKKRHKHNSNKHNKNICSKLLNNSNNSNINEIADISNKLESTFTSSNKIKHTKAKKKFYEEQNFTSPSKENRLDIKNKNMKKLKKIPENETREIVEMESAIFTSPKKLITGHFVTELKNKRNIELEENVENKSDDKIIEIAEELGSDMTISKNLNNSDNLNGSRMNAFDFLMNSRNKSIGRNSPGRELFDGENDCDQTNIEQNKNYERKVQKTKRKYLLEEMVEKKVGNKRKFIELDESRGEYIELQLNKRAKRLRKMLTEPKKVERSLSPEIIKEKSHVRKKHAKKIKSLDINSSDLYSNEDINFVAKLSSPIKKKDNLLGYFPKGFSPSLQINQTTSYITTDIDIPISNITRKKRGRPKGKATSTITSNSKNVNSESTSITTVSNFEEISPRENRPRRSCAGKARYDYDLEVDNAKPKKKSSKNLKIVMDQNEMADVIILDISDTQLNEIVPKKLAPVFIKTIPKPSVDPEVLKARQEFLMSGVPDIMKKEMLKQKIFEEGFEAVTKIFPTISHVPEWKININCFNGNILKKKWVGIQTEDIDINIWKNSILKKPSTKFSEIENVIYGDFKNNANLILLPLKTIKLFEYKKEVLKIWKTLYNKFPTYKCYNQLRQKYHYFNSSDTGEDHHQISESFIVTCRLNRSLITSINNDKDFVPPPSAPNGELLYTEKYKPLSYDQFLVNVSSLNCLKEFLSGCQNNNKCDKAESTDDFEDSNSIPVSVNTIVLVGPKSSGKTSAVFALANEMNFKVLEINAGMKRTGKKLLQDLQEATQSHQVQKDSNSIKKSLENKNSKKKILNENSNSLVDLNSEKMSLILLEDADVVFDQHDSGFIDAIYQLSATSKRPVVIMANNYNCEHLNRLINNNYITFPSLNPEKISKFISILTLIENCPISLNDILSLYLFNSMDLRKTILEVQFFIQSGGDRELTNKKFVKVKPTFCSFSRKTKNLLNNFEDVNLECTIENYMHSNLFNFYSNSQNYQYKIPIPINYNILWNNLNNIFSVSKNLKDCENATKTCSEKVLNNLVDFYENISVANYFDKPIDFTDRLQKNIGEEISHYLVENSLKENLKLDEYSYNLYDEPPTERTILTSSLPNFGLFYKNKSIALDYEPNLRAICRSEKERSLHERRGSRFYHYLRNNWINLSEADSFNDSCKIFLDFISVKE